MNLLQSDQFSKAGKLLDPLHGLHPPSLEVHLQRCPSCQLSDLLLTVNATSLNSKGNLQLKEVAQGMLSLSQYNKFREAVAENLSQIEHRFIINNLNASNTISRFIIV